MGPLDTARSAKPLPLANRVRGVLEYGFISKFRSPKVVWKALGSPAVATRPRPESRHPYSAEQIRPSTETRHRVSSLLVYNNVSTGSVWYPTDNYTRTWDNNLVYLKPVTHVQRERNKE